MLNQFIDQVVSQGATALLPHNLDEQWLDMLYVAARHFLKTAINADDGIQEEDFLNDANSMMMLSAVVEIAQYQDGYTPGEKPYEVPEEDLFEFISCYALSVIMESISKHAELVMDPPDADNIFDRDRLYAVEQANPSLTEVLNRLISE